MTSKWAIGWGLSTNQFKSNWFWISDKWLKNIAGTGDNDSYWHIDRCKCPWLRPTLALVTLFLVFPASEQKLYTPRSPSLLGKWFKHRHAHSRHFSDFLGMHDLSLWIFLTSGRTFNSSSDPPELFVAEAQNGSRCLSSGLVPNHFTF